MATLWELRGNFVSPMVRLGYVTLIIGTCNS